MIIDDFPSIQWTNIVICDPVLCAVRRAQLDNRGVTLWCATFDVAGTGDPCDGEIVSATRLAHAGKKRLAEFFAGRRLARVALAHAGHTETWLARSSSGAPIWPSGFSGSLSHKRNVVTVMLGPSSLRLGVDVEEPFTGFSLDAISRRALSKTERQSAGDSPFGRALCTTILFSAKEALYKALSPEVRVRFGFEAAELNAPPQNGRLTLKLTRTLTPALPAGASFELCYSGLDGRVLTWLSAPRPPKPHRRSSR